MENPFINLLGAMVIEVSPGYARIRAEVTARHLNRNGYAHGGFINSLADIAFEYASNSHGINAVGISTSIQFLRPVVAGVTLEAIATELHCGRTIGTYQIKVVDGEKLVAFFTGTVARERT